MKRSFRTLPSLQHGNYALVVPELPTVTVNKCFANDQKQQNIDIDDNTIKAKRPKTNSDQ